MHATDVQNWIGLGMHNWFSFLGHPHHAKLYYAPHEQRVIAVIMDHCGMIRTESAALGDALREDWNMCLSLAQRRVRRAGLWPEDVPLPTPRIAVEIQRQGWWATKCHG